MESFGYTQDAFLLKHLRYRATVFLAAAVSKCARRFSRTKLSGPLFLWGSVTSSMTSLCVSRVQNSQSYLNRRTLKQLFVFSLFNRLGRCDDKAVGSDYANYCANCSNLQYFGLTIRPIAPSWDLIVYVVSRSSEKVIVTTIIRFSPQMDATTNSTDKAWRYLLARKSPLRFEKKITQNKKKQQRKTKPLK